MTEQQDETRTRRAGRAIGYGLGVLVAAITIVFVVIPIIGIALGLVLLVLVIVLPLVFVLGVLRREMLPPLHGNGAEAERSLPVSAFEEVDVGDDLEVHITCGNEPAVRVVGDQNLLEWIAADVWDKAVRLTTRRRLVPSAGLRVEVTARTLTQIRQSGSSRIAAGELDMDTLTIKSSGSGRIDLSGICRSLHVNVSGSARLSAKDLNCENVFVRLTGSSEVRVHAHQELSAVVSGSGRVTCHGGPENVRRQVSGSGEVTVV